MALRDLLNLQSSVSVLKTTATNDGMGGFTSTTETTVLSLAALWQNTSDDKWLSNEIAKTSTHTLCLEHDTYLFNSTTSLTSTQTIAETISYNGHTFKAVGFCNNVLELGEIDVQALELIE